MFFISILSFFQYVNKSLPWTEYSIFHANEGLSMTVAEENSHLFQVSKRPLTPKDHRFPVLTRTTNSFATGRLGFGGNALVTRFRSTAHIRH